MITDTVIAGLSGKKVLVVGDCMLDAYLTGDAERISPEAPVPVVRIDHELYYLGGAGNVARNVAALGGEATLIGGAGQDEAGERLRTLLHNEGVTPGLAVLRRPTTVKTRVLAQRQQMLRLDKEDSRPYTQEETVAIMQLVQDNLPGHDVVILSDYNKGLFTQAFMATFRHTARKRGLQVLVDPKPANIRLFSEVTLLTPNAKETAECAARLGAVVSGGLDVRESVLAAGQEILTRVGSRHLLTTLGPDGMALFVSPNEVWHIPTVARDVFDVTGAGDTVIATLGLSMAAGNDLLASCVLANYAAGIVVAQVGAAVSTQDGLKNAIRQQDVRVERW